jgi:hypothetical protein
MEVRIKSLCRSILRQVGQKNTWLASLPLLMDRQRLRNLSEEHHIGNFDSASFFSLHDYDDNGFWDRGEILKTYGMDDPSAKDVPQEKKEEIVREVLKLMDSNNNGIVEREEWTDFTQERKGTLPDFGLGPGHHWDIEIEYEIHHWEK